jgi:outer membrane lipoprotein-sorting protein
MYKRRIALAAVVPVLALSACHRNAGRAVTAKPGSTAKPASPAKLARYPQSGLEVIGWMRRAHPSRALRTLSFDVSTVVERGGREVERQAKAYAALPGRLRIDQLPASRQAGWVRNRQRLAVFDRGRRVSTSNRVDLGTLLAYDVFAQSIDTTIMWLDSANIRFALLRRDFLYGRAVWVVGAPRGDEKSPQFWVDAERWRVVRVIQRDLRGRTVDVRYTEYTELLDIPVPTRIVTYVDGALLEQQQLGNFATNPPVPPRAFDLARWRRVTAAGN